MKILITGIHGFVGSNLVAAYKNQHTLYGLDIVSPPKEGIEATYAWDEWEKIPAVDTIIHLAGKAHDTKNTADAQSYFDVNLGLTQKIFDYFLQSDAKKFIFFSSVKAVADTVPNDVLTENDTPNPQTPYGQSKLAAEQYITVAYAVWLKNKEQSIGNRDQRTENSEQRKKSVYILRPAMIHGPGNKGNLNLLFEVIQKGIPWPLGSFYNQRSLLSFGNLIFVIKQIILHDIKPGVYQIADDEPISTNDIIQLIGQSLNKKTRILHIPKFFIVGLAKIGELFHLPLNSERLKKLTESYVVSNQELKEALHINSFPVSTEEGLKRTFNSFNK